VNQRLRRFATTSALRDPVILVLLVAILPLFLDEFRLRAFAGFLALAVLAMSLGFAWGYGGILSFGQGAFFGIGAYLVAFALTKDLPAFYGWGAALASLAIAVLIAVALGWFVFDRRVTTFYVAVFTLVLSALAQQLVGQFPDVTGGLNGLIIPHAVFPPDPNADYYLMWLLFAGVLLVLSAIARTDFGRILHAVRENPDRARFLGYDSSRVKVIVFGISAAVAALGGLAYSLYLQLASPDLVGFAFSTEVLIWVAIGGRGALVGAALGALLVNIGTEELSANLLVYWHLILGLAFIAVVMIFPDGLYSIVRRLTARFEASENYTLNILPAPRLNQEGVVLEVHDLSQNFGTFRALDGVSLAVHASELRCLIGPNGAGKSTLVDVLSCRVDPSGGEAKLLGASILGKSPDKVARDGLSRKFQATNVFDRLSVAENLRLAASAGPIQPAMFLRRTSEIQLTAPVAELLHDCGLEDLMNEQAGSLSHGLKQWLELCMVLAGRPVVVLLDEPTAGLTVEERRTIGRILRRLASTGLSIVLIEHDFDFVREVADQVTVLHQGRVIAEGNVDDVSNAMSVRDVYLGMPA
jgi:urea transport system permease protein/urea transport system ATP-binding protein